MGYGLVGRVSIPVRGKIFDFTASRPAFGPPILLSSEGNGAISSAVKRPEREAGHSPPTGAESKNIGALRLLASCVFTV
jgi:hypothetical protein